MVDLSTGEALQEASQAVVEGMEFDQEGKEEEGFEEDGDWMIDSSTGEALQAVVKGMEFEHFDSSLFLIFYSLPNY